MGKIMLMLVVAAMLAGGAWPIAMLLAGIALVLAIREGARR